MFPQDVVDQANTAYRNYNTDGNPASGIYQPDKGLIRTLFMTTASAIALAGGVAVAYVESFGGNADALYSANTATIGNGSKNLRVDAANFTDDDIGKLIVVTRAGAPGASDAPLVTTIEQVTNGQNVVTADAAGAAVADGEVFWGTDCTDAINAAIVYLQAFITGGMIQLQGGAYLTQGGHDLRATSATIGVVHIRGIGPGRLTHIFHVGNNKLFRTGCSTFAAPLFGGGSVTDMWVDGIQSKWGTAAATPTNAAFVQVENAFGISVKRTINYGYFYGEADFVIKNSILSGFTEGACFEDVISNSSRIQFIFTADSGADGSYNQFRCLRVYQNMGIATDLHGFTVCNQFQIPNDGVAKTVYDGWLDRGYWPPSNMGYRSVEIFEPGVDGAFNMFSAVDFCTSDGPNTASDVSNNVYYYHDGSGASEGQGRYSVELHQRQSQARPYYLMDATSGAPLETPTFNAIFFGDLNGTAVDSLGMPLADIRGLSFPVMLLLEAGATCTFNTGYFPALTPIKITFAGSYDDNPLGAIYDCLSRNPGASNVTALTGGALPSPITFAAIGADSRNQIVADNTGSIHQLNMLMRYQIGA